MGILIMPLPALEAFTGWTLGYSQALENKVEAEVRQGKNYYLAALSQSIIFSQILAAPDFLIDKLPQGMLKTALRINSLVTPFIGLAFFPFCALVKHEHYTNAAEALNAKKLRWLPQIPGKLGPRTVRFCNFIAEHSSKMLRVASIVTAVALFVFYSPYYGSGILVGLAYEMIDNAGLLPRKVSLFMETYLGTVAHLGSLLLLTSSPLLRTINVLSIGSTICPAFSTFMLHTIDSIVQRCFRMQGIRLKAFEAPLHTNKQMSYDEITRILNDKSTYQIDPAHCSKQIEDIHQLPENRSFDRFLVLFDTVPWNTKYEYVKRKLVDDERFLDFIKEKFPGTTSAMLQNRAGNASYFDERMTELASREKITKEQYVARWLREQMRELVGVLDGRIRVKGLQSDLQAAIDNSAKILAHLDRVNLLRNRVEIEDSLIKMTVEGGAYCARGLKRVTAELVDTIILNAVQPGAQHNDAATGFEMRVRGALQARRQEIVQLVYQIILQANPALQPVGQDVHTFDMYRLALTLGFFPLTQLDRNNNVGVGMLPLWEMLASVRTAMVDIYEKTLDVAMQGAIKEIGDIHLPLYVNKLITENARLSPQQKTELTNRITDTWAQPETQKGFRRLVLVSLGILKKS